MQQLCGATHQQPDGGGQRSGQKALPRRKQLVGRADVIGEGEVAGLDLRWKRQGA